MTIGDTYYHPNLLLIFAYPVVFLLFFSLTGVYQYFPMVWMALIVLAISALSILVDAIRVRKFVEKDGGRLTSMRWAPFGPGRNAFTRRNANIYKVEYVNSLGTALEGHVRVSLFFGVETTD
jgi:hypothetical protein